MSRNNQTAWCVHRFDNSLRGRSPADQPSAFTVHSPRLHSKAHTACTACPVRTRAALRQHAQPRQRRLHALDTVLNLGRGGAGTAAVPAPGNSEQGRRRGRQAGRHSNDTKHVPQHTPVPRQPGPAAGCTARPRRAPAWHSRQTPGPGSGGWHPGCGCAQSAGAGAGEGR